MYGLLQDIPPELKIKLLFIIPYIIICSVFDLKRKEIPLWLFAVGFLADVIYMVYMWEGEISFYLYGVTTGLVVFFIARYTGQIGKGDGILLGITGLLMGFEYTVKMFMWALVITAFTSVFILIFLKWNKNKTIAFVPFMLIGVLIAVIM